MQAEKFDHIASLSPKTNTIIEEVIELKQKHSETWRKKSEFYWLSRLMQETGELASALVNDHEHSVDWELAQIASITLNWLEYRLEKIKIRRFEL